MARKTNATKAKETVETKAVEVKEETAVAETPAVSKKEEAPKKKTTKTATTKTPVAEKKSVAKKTTKAETQANIFIQYQGVELSYADLVERAKNDADVKSPKVVNIYVKPEENMVYYVVDEKVGGFQLA